jgi:phosphate-selective porin OprO and OprP
LAARLSYIDLNDAGISGGQMTDMTLGANWYLNPFTKVQANYVHAFVQDPGITHPGNRVPSDTGFWGLRMQMDF